MTTGQLQHFPTLDITSSPVHQSTPHPVTHAILLLFTIHSSRDVSSDIYVWRPAFYISMSPRMNIFIRNRRLAVEIELVGLLVCFFIFCPSRVPPNGELFFYTPKLVSETLIFNASTTFATLFIVLFIQKFRRDSIIHTSRQTNRRRECLFVYTANRNAYYIHQMARILYNIYTYILVYIVYIYMQLSYTHIETYRMHTIRRDGEI